MKFEREHKKSIKTTLDNLILIYNLVFFSSISFSKDLTQTARKKEKRKEKR